MNDIEMDPERKNLLALMAMLGMAVLGGVASQARQWLQGRKLTWRHIVARAVISAFIGFLSWYLLPPAPWAGAVCGFAGWAGADGVGMVMQFFVKPKN